MPQSVEQPAGSSPAMNGILRSHMVSPVGINDLQVPVQRCTQARTGTVMVGSALPDKQQQQHLGGMLQYWCYRILCTQYRRRRAVIANKGGGPFGGIEIPLGLRRKGDRGRQQQMPAVKPRRNRNVGGISSGSHSKMAPVIRRLPFAGGPEPQCVISSLGANDCIFFFLSFLSARSLCSTY